MTSKNEKQENDIIVGSNIKRERELAGYTQDQFSELVGLGPKSLSAVERGSVGISMVSLRRICNTLHIPSDAIVFGDQPLNDTTKITQKLERLSPAQFKIAAGMLNYLFQAFAIEDAFEPETETESE